VLLRTSKGNWLGSAKRKLKYIVKGGKDISSLMKEGSESVLPLQITIGCTDHDETLFCFTQCCL
jgi:hypothetical protein